MENMQNRKITASVISIAEQQASSVFMDIEMRMLSTRPNLNNEAVTAEFIDEIVANQSKYVCLPLYADVSKLVRGDYRGLGHMYDRKTGEFYSTEIGSFSSFSKVEDEYGVSLIGKARVAKRNRKICQALSELFDQGNLNFSFELNYVSAQIKDNVLLIDADKNNSITGMAVVSIPAYPEAKALALVAEVDSIHAFEKAEISISEVDFETIRMQLWGYVMEQFKENDMAYYIRFEKVCPDCAIIYNTKTAQTIKIEYVVQEDKIVISDIYEVAYQRKVDERQMELEQALARISELETKVTEAETKLTQATDTVAQLNTEKDALIAEKAQLETAKAEVDASKTAVEAELATLKQTVAELEPFKAEAERLAAEQAKAELDAKKAKLKAFAESHKLDVTNETVAQAIDNLNYEVLIAESQKLEEEASKNTGSVAIATFVGMSASGSGNFGGILEDA